MATRASLAARNGRKVVLDVERVRADFPILATTMRGKPLAYLDNANSTQKPRQVLDAETRFYESRYANIHRGVYHLSQQATEMYDAARESVRRLLNARDPHEIVFLRGTTEAMNLVAHGFGATRLQEGDEVVISALEHHAGIVPWQMACEKTGAKLRVIPMTDDGDLRLDEAERILGPRAKVLSILHVSNALGTILPVRELIALAHARGIPVVVDGAQAVTHARIDVVELDCEFYCFSGHKLYGPTGIGALYGKAEWLAKLPPWQGGGDMIRTVTFEKTTYNDVPYRFEAGTPNIAGAIGLAAAIDYVHAVGFDAIAAHERTLLEHACASLALIPEVRLLGGPHEKVGVVSFLVDGVHPHDVGTVLDLDGVAVRAGHHCAQPLMDRLGVPATVRASFAMYNTTAEVDRLAAAVQHAVEVFR